MRQVQHGCVHHAAIEHADAALRRFHGLLHVLRVRHGLWGGGKYLVDHRHLGRMDAQPYPMRMARAASLAMRWVSRVSTVTPSTGGASRARREAMTMAMRAGSSSDSSAPQHMPAST